MPYNEALAERIRVVLTGRLLDFEEMRMFGGLVFMVDARMLVGVTKDELMVRVGPEAHAAALDRPGARPMEMSGRTMKGFVFVGPAGCDADADLQAWIDRALAYTATIPKTRKRTKSKR